MPTIYGDWQASDRARFVCVYSVAKTNGGTDATQTATIKLETRYEVYDTSNTWKIGGTLDSKSGSNLNINHGSSGGTTTIGTVSKVKTHNNGTVTVELSGTIYGTISESFTIPIGALAREITSFTASNIEQTSFTANLISSTSVGTASNVAARVNTSASPTGSNYQYKSSGSWKDVAVTGLTPGTKYYFSMRAATTQYGWGPWTGWKSFETLPGVYVRYGGTWRNAIPYVRYNNAWKEARRYVRTSSGWK